MKQTFMRKKFLSMLAGGTLTSMVVSVLIMLDTVISGIFIGEKAVAGINLVSPLYNLASFFAMLFSLGIPILYSKAVGDFDDDRADKIFHVGLTSSVIIGLIMFILTYFFKEEYLHFFGADPEIYDYAAAYCSWMPVLFLILPLQNLMCEMIYSDGDEGLNLAANIAEITAKTIFSILLASRLGTAGIAVGSLIGALLSTAVCLAHLFKVKNSLKPGIFISKEILFESVDYGMTDSGVWLFMAVFSAVLTKYVAYSFGSDMLILVSVVNLVRGLQLFFDGIGEAITPIISIYYSEKCFAGIKNIWKIAGKIAAAEGVILAILCLIAADEAPDLLGISDAAISGYTRVGVRILALSLPAVSITFLLSSYYLIAGRTGFSFLINAMRDALLSVLFAVAGNRLFGIYGMFSGIALAPYASWLFVIIYVRLKYGRNAYPLILNKEEESVRSYLFEFRVLPEEIVRTRDRAGEILLESGYEKQSVGRAMLLFEEIFMMISEKNKDTKVCAECSIVAFADTLKLVGRDDGISFDLSDIDMKIESLGSYVISRLTSQKAKVSKHLVAMSFNSNMFELTMSRTS